MSLLWDSMHNWYKVVGSVTFQELYLEPDYVCLNTLFDLITALVKQLQQLAKYLDTVSPYHTCSEDSICLW